MKQLQDDKLTGEISSVDVSTEENLNNLAKIAENLLNKPVSRVNFETGNYEPSGEKETNAQALTRYKIAPILLLLTFSPLLSSLH